MNSFSSPEWTKFRGLRRRATGAMEAEISDYELAIRAGLTRDTGRGMEWKFGDEMGDVLKIERVAEDYR